jgi:hypothetical protein
MKINLEIKITKYTNYDDQKEGLCKRALLKNRMRA